MEFYAPMLIMTGVVMLVAMALTLLPEFSWWARRQQLRIRHHREQDEE